MDGNFPFEFIGFGAMNVDCLNEFMRFGPMDQNFAYEIIGFGAMDNNCAYESMAFGTRDDIFAYELIDEAWGHGWQL